MNQVAPGLLVLLVLATAPAHAMETSARRSMPT